MGDGFPVEYVRDALTSAEVAPASVDTWAAEGSCFAAVALALRDAIPYVAETVVLRSDDAGATWRGLGRVEGRWGGATGPSRAAQWVWATYEGEGTFATVYRFDGEHLARVDALDAAVRAHGGCCFTGVDAIVARDRDAAVLQVHGLDDVPADAPHAGWFETTDGGQHVTWLGVGLPAAWTATPPAAVGPAPAACVAATAAFYAPR